MIAFTSVLAESETFALVVTSNVAVSPDPFGALGGIQLRSVFQSPEVGIGLQMALPA